MTSVLLRIRSRIAALLPGRDDLAELRRDPRRDLLAGLTVAVVALPLALGFGVSSGSVPRPAWRPPSSPGHSPRCSAARTSRCPGRPAP